MNGSLVGRLNDRIEVPVVYSWRHLRSSPAQMILHAFRVRLEIDAL